MAEEQQQNPAAAAAAAAAAAGPSRQQQYSGDIPVLNELASLIGSLGLETPNKYKYRETDESIAAELKEVCTALLLFVLL